MIPLATPNLSGNEARYLQECVDSTYVSSVGPFVERLEDMVAAASGAAGAVATSSGTAGLHAALLTLGVGYGDLVVVPSYTFIASANAVAHCGAEPWLMDVALDSWTLDADLLERSLEAETETRDNILVHSTSGRRVAAIVAVYTLGLPADMDRITQIAKRFALPVVADAAAALGATYKDRAVGDLGADLSVFSFNGNKTVTAGGGGAVVSADATLLAGVRHLTTTARVGDDYDHDRVGYNYRMTNLQAAVGCAQMEQLDAFVAAKRRIAARYNAELADLAGASPFPAPKWADSACWFSGVVVDTPLPQVDDMIAQLRGRGIAARAFWKPMHLQAPYKDAPATGMDVSDAIWTRVLTLPCSTHLTDGEQEQAIAAFHDAVRALGRGQ